MSLWLERLNELARYEDFRREAQNNQLTHQGKKGYQKILKVLQRRQRLGGIPDELVDQTEALESNLMIHKQDRPASSRDGSFSKEATMNAPSISSKLATEGTWTTRWMQRIALSLLFIACGLLVFLVFSHYDPFYHGKTDKVGRVVVSGVFLALALFTRFNQRFQKYWLIPFAYFVGLTAISLDLYLGLSQWLYPRLGIAERSPAGLAVDKLESSLVGILVVLILNRLAGQNLASLYIRRGNLRLALIVGLVAFAVMSATVIPVTETYFKGINLTWTRILSWSPWVLVFVLSNASNEELLFRGLFIGKMEPFLGKFLTNLVTTIPFVLVHSYTRYATDQTVFLALQVLPVSLAWCWLMQKTNNIWGSILFHAAMDIPIVVGIFSSL